jgi:hypothetical protein
VSGAAQLWRALARCQDVEPKRSLTPIFARALVTGTLDRRQLQWRNTKVVQELRRGASTCQSNVAGGHQRRTALVAQWRAARRADQRRIVTCVPLFVVVNICSCRYRCLLSSLLLFWVSIVFRVLCERRWRFKNAQPFAVELWLIFYRTSRNIATGGSMRERRPTAPAALQTSASMRESDERTLRKVTSGLEIFSVFACVFVASVAFGIVVVIFFVFTLYINHTLDFFFDNRILS